MRGLACVAVRTAVAVVCVMQAATSASAQTALQILTAEIADCTANGGSLEWPDDPDNWGTATATWPDPTTYTVQSFAYCADVEQISDESGNVNNVDKATAVAWCEAQTMLGNDCFAIMFHNGNSANEETRNGFSSNPSTKKKWRACYGGPAFYDETDGFKSYSAYNYMCIMPTTEAGTTSTTTTTTTPALTSTANPSTTSDIADHTSTYGPAPAPASTTTPEDVDCSGKFTRSNKLTECGAYDCGLQRQWYQTFLYSVFPQGNGRPCDYPHNYTVYTNCSLPPCDVDCEGSWGAWSECGASCLVDEDDIVTHSRTFNITVERRWYGADCIAEDGDTDVAHCDIDLCPINCEGEWSEWGTLANASLATLSNCPVSCGSFNQSRQYLTVVASQGDGLDCPAANNSYEHEDCAPLPCPVDCKAADVQFSDCSASCGGGYESWAYVIEVDPAFGGENCTAANMTGFNVECNTQMCPVNCVGAWGSWTDCTESCAGGTTGRTFFVSVEAQNGGEQCSEVSFAMQAANCSTQACPSDCEGAWGGWSDCLVTCGNGTEFRTFETEVLEEFGGATCAAENATVDERACHTDPCPVDCIGSWTEFTPCSVSCNTGTKNKTFVVSQPAEFGGVSCPYAHGVVDVKECRPTYLVYCNETTPPTMAVSTGSPPTTGAAPTEYRNESEPLITFPPLNFTDNFTDGGGLVDLGGRDNRSEPELPGRQATVSAAADGNLTCPYEEYLECPVSCEGAWEEWGACSHSCGIGIRTRLFDVSQASFFGGEECNETHGASLVTSCNTHPCPIDCEGNYSDWSTCSHSCGNGTKWRTFNLTRQAQFGGAACEAAHDFNDTAPCFDRYCPIHCVGEWSEWTDCSKSCGTGANARTFSVVSTELYGGVVCEWDDGYVDTGGLCNTQPCPINCKGDWLPWSNCSESCAGGTQLRTYEVWQHASYGGMECDLNYTYYSGPNTTAGMYTGASFVSTAPSLGSTVAAEEEEGGNGNLPNPLATRGFLISTDGVVVTTQAASTTMQTTWTTGMELSAMDTNASVYIRNQSGFFIDGVLQYADYAVEGAPCNPQPCPQHCEGSWTEWGDCDRSCGFGGKTRQFIHNVSAMYGGDACVFVNSSEDALGCNAFLCPVDCVGNWSSWSDCDRSCGNGTQERTYSHEPFAAYGGINCTTEHNTTVQRQCFELDCPVDCIGDWSSWGDCSFSCDNHNGSLPISQRTFEVSVPAQYGGVECQPFADLHVSTMGMSSTAGIVTAANIIHTTGAVATTPPGPGGPVTESRRCGFNTCPVDCVGFWSEWTDCDTTCGLGRITRDYRIVSEESFGGAACAANDSYRETETCLNHPCPVDCHGDWTPWGDCSTSCFDGNETGMHSRVFRIVKQAAYGGINCSIANGEVNTSACNEQPCPVDCVGNWSQWSDCSVSCGGANQTRQFVVAVADEYGGIGCLFEHFENITNWTNYTTFTTTSQWNNYTVLANVTVNGTLVLQNVSVNNETLVFNYTHHANPNVTQRLVRGGHIPNNTVAQRVCAADACPIDCEGVWSNFSDCDASCGGGQSVRTFTGIVEVDFGGQECEFGNGQEDVVSCNNHSCPVDCEGFWSPWSSCDLSCGTGQRNRTFNVTVPAQFGGQQCREVFVQYVRNGTNGTLLMNETTAILNGDPITTALPIVVTTTSFNVTAMNNSRCQTTNNGVADCLGKTPPNVCCTSSLDGLFSTQCRPENICQLSNGVYPALETTTTTTTTTSTITVTTTTTTTTVLKIVSFGDTVVHGQNDTKDCATQPCPQDCVSAWTEWTDCTFSCNSGSQQRTYVIDTFHAFGGELCIFDENLTLAQRECSAQPCPIDCEGNWTAWSECTETCGIGSQTRTFVHTNGSQFGGANCSHEHDHNVTISCNTEPCPVDCVGMWLEWGDCDATCNVTNRSRAFHVNSSDHFGGEPCPAEHDGLDVQACEVIPCPVDCAGNWTNWTQCSVSCGGSTIERTFEVSVNARHGGAICDFDDGDVATAECSTASCPVDCVGLWDEWSDCTQTCNSGLEFRTFEVSIPVAFGGVPCSWVDAFVANQSCSTEGCEGCPDSTACNFQDFATVDDDSCTYPEEHYNCAGKCISPLDACDECGGDNSTCDGCTDTSGCNYDFKALVDDGLCSYPDLHFDCVGKCISDKDCAGVCGGTGTRDLCGVCNSDNSSCTGCMDSTACNFDSNALVASGNCSYAVEFFDCFGVCAADEDCKGTCGGLVQKDVCGVCGGDNASCTGCMDTDACNYDPRVLVGAASSCVFPEKYYNCSGECAAGVDCAGVCGGTLERDSCDICGGNGTACQEGFCPPWVLYLDCFGVCEGPAREDLCGVCDGDSTTCAECNISTACNYNPPVLVNDSSLCKFPASALKTCAGLCAFDIDCGGECNGTLVEDGCGICDGDNSTCSGCTDSTACNFDADAVFDEPGACSYAKPNFNCKGSCAVDIDCEGTCGGAASYDACELCGGDSSSCAGCKDTTACSYDEDALLKDNDLCTYPEEGESCFGDCFVDVDCAGTCGGTLVEDGCGKCDGDNSGCYVAFGAEFFVANVESGAAVKDLQSRVSNDIEEEQLVSFHGRFDSSIPRTEGTATIILCGLSNTAIDATVTTKLQSHFAWGFNAGVAQLVSRKRDASGACDTDDAVELEVDLMSSDVVCSGSDNFVVNGFSAVLGGEANTVTGNHSVIHAGLSNRVIGDGSLVAGGTSNTVRGNYSTIGGGAKNRLVAKYGSVLGGSSNVAISNYGAIIGGFRNLVRGRHAVAVGGSMNTAGGVHSVAMGQYAHAKHDDSLVLSFAGKSYGMCKSQGEHTINVCADSLWVNDYDLGENFDFVASRRLSDEPSRVHRLKQQALRLMQELARQEKLINVLERL